MSLPNDGISTFEKRGRQAQAGILSVPRHVIPTTDQAPGAQRGCLHGSLPGSQKVYLATCRFTANDRTETLGKGRSQNRADVEPYHSRVVRHDGLFTEETAWHFFFQVELCSGKGLLCFTSLTNNRLLCAGHWLHTVAFLWPSPAGRLGLPPPPDFSVTNLDPKLSLGIVEPINKTEPQMSNKGQIILG